MAEQEVSACSLAAHRKRVQPEDVKNVDDKSEREKNYRAIVEKLLAGGNFNVSGNQSEIDALGNGILKNLSDAVTAAGLAESQEEYEKNYHIVFERLDRLEDRLGDRCFLVGDEISDSDVRLYVILIRFDVAYYFAYRLNERRIQDYPNLRNYVKELYSIPAFREATDFDEIKRKYLMGIDINPDQILPEGPDLRSWEVQGWQ